MAKQVLVGDGSLDSQGRPVLWKVPDAYVSAAGVFMGQVVDPTLWGWPQYNYAEAQTLSDQCGASAPIETAAPTWSALTPPVAVPGASYSWTVPTTSATPAAGHNISEYSAVTLPVYLTATKNSSGALVITGTIPATASGTIAIQLRALQDNGKKADTSGLSISVQGVTIDALLQYVVSDKYSILRIGPAGASAPTVTITGPASWTDTVAHLAAKDAATTKIGATTYYWYLRSTNMLAGDYQAKIDYLGQTLYASWTVGSVGLEKVLALSTTPLGNTPSYRVWPQTAINEGSSQVFALQQQQGLNWVDVAGATIRIENAKAGTTLSGKTVSVAANNVQGDSYQLTIWGDLNGAPTAQASINIVDTTPATTYCSVLTEVAYYINNKGVGSQVDSIGFYYLGSATKYKLFVESVSQAGLMELLYEGTNGATTLSGNLAKYNHLIVQAYAGRKWRDASYKVQLQILDGTSVIRDVTFTVDMTQPSVTPINVHTCSGPTVTGADPALLLDLSGQDPDSIDFFPAS